MAETLLLLARHGATDENLKRPYILLGRKLDPGLADLGKKQAKALGERVRRDFANVSHVFASPLRRAQETAHAVADPLGLKVHANYAIIEVDMGHWEGLTWDQVHERFPTEFAAFQEDEAEKGYSGGGETYFQIRDRTVAGIDALVKAHPGETILVVSHNVVNRVALAHWMNVPLRHARRLPQFNAGLNIIQFRDGAARVRTINEAAHLTGLLPPD